MPQPEDRGILLRDILEENVDEKYFLSEKMLNYFDKRAANFNNGKVNIRKGTDKATTITASCKSVDISDNFIIAMRGRELVAIGCDYRSDEGIRIKSDGKSGTLCARARNDESCGQMVINQTQRIRRLTTTECSRLQTVPSWYKWECSDTQQYKLLGNGWTIEVIKHILKYLI